MTQPPEFQLLTPPLNDQTDGISKRRFVMPDLEGVRRRAQEYLQKIENDRREADAERRAGRKKGHLGKGLLESLRNCNPLQLRAVRKLVAKYEKDHRTPPSISDCQQKQTVEIIAHADVRNRRYTLELQRSSQSRGKVYVNGPYVVLHHRDGAIIKHEYIGSKRLSTRLPRSVWPVFRPHINSPETCALIDKHNKAWAEKEDEE